MADVDNLRWFESFNGSRGFERFRERPVAYFCAEFALENRVRTFSGGLGVLAGDVVREAIDRGFPLIGVGLYYRQGYVCQVKDDDGEPIKFCEAVAPETVGLEPVLRPNGDAVIVRVPIQDRDVHCRAWRWTRGAVSVYLLDTDVHANGDADRSITNRLYVGDKQTRLKQELVLGIGGLRLLEAIGVHPSTYHLNEGHSAFFSYELIRHEMTERKLGFDEAKQYARRRIVLTNHTLVAAGNEVFSNDLVSLMLGRYAQELQVPVSDLVKPGLVQESSEFSMTMLAFRMSSIINSVSKLHSRKAKELWTDHPMVAVTNGVHVPTWDALGGDTFAPGALWDAHQQKKTELLEEIRKRGGRSWGKDELLIGWARRITGYKRPMAVIDDIDGFGRLARAAGRPVRIVFSGLPHPNDTGGQAMLRELRRHTDSELKDVAVFLADYDFDLALRMVSGCDVWLNTPVVGFEACGTSGMKAALNGVLPCSTQDGWVAEADLFKIGWLLDTVHITESVLGIIANDIVPMYYSRNAGGVAELWEEHMRNARALIKDRFSATRMLREYVEMLYT